MTCGDRAWIALLLAAGAAHAGCSPLDSAGDVGPPGPADGSAEAAPDRSADSSAPDGTFEAATDDGGDAADDGGELADVVPCAPGQSGIPLTLAAVANDDGTIAYDVCTPAGDAVKYTYQRFGDVTNVVTQSGPARDTLSLTTVASGAFYSIHAQECPSNAGCSDPNAASLIYDPFPAMLWGDIHQPGTYANALVAGREERDGGSVPDFICAVPYSNGTHLGHMPGDKLGECHVSWGGNDNVADAAAPVSVLEGSSRPIFWQRWPGSVIPSGAVIGGWEPANQQYLCQAVVADDEAGTVDLVPGKTQSGACDIARNGKEVWVTPQQAAVYLMIWDPTAGADAGPDGGVSACSGANLVANGDFAAGADGEFASDYTLENTISSAAQYTIASNPSKTTSDLSWASITARGGSGQMLIANGDTGAADVWRQTVTVKPNTTYTFTYWTTNIDITDDSPPNLLARLQAYVGTTPLGAVFIPSVTAGTWGAATAQWSSGDVTKATFSIKDMSVEQTNNDFALDDISLVECP